MALLSKMMWEYAMPNFPSFLDEIMGFVFPQFVLAPLFSALTCPVNEVDVIRGSCSFIQASALP